MKNVIKLIGIAILVSAIGVSMLSCDDGGGPGGNGGGGGGGSGGSLTVTGIPAEYNGRYAIFSPRTGFSGIRDEVSGDSRISNRRVTIPVVRTGYPVEAYNGNDIVNIEVTISERPLYDVIASVRFDSVQFRNGRATVDWSDRR